MMAQEFSQTVGEEDAQPCQDAQSCHRYVPGMSQYGDSQDIYSDNHDVDTDVGTEDSQGADQKSAAISQRCEFFSISSPR